MEVIACVDVQNTKNLQSKESQQFCLDYGAPLQYEAFLEKCRGDWQELGAC